MLLNPIQDATRLEMSFFGEIKGWGDLQSKVRCHLIRSCSQHVSAEKSNLDRILDNRNLYPIIEDLREVCYALEKERLLHGGRKNYHLMVAAYFSDLAKVWISLRRVCKDGAKVCFVVGDSAPYGIYVPVDKWLGELAILTSIIRKTRQTSRNINLHKVYQWGQN